MEGKVRLPLDCYCRVHFSRIILQPMFTLCCASASINRKTSAHKKLGALIDAPSKNVFAHKLFHTRCFKYRW